MGNHERTDYGPSPAAELTEHDPQMQPHAPPMAISSWCQAAVIKHQILFATAVVILAAYVFPDGGAAIYPSLNMPIIICLFLTLGITLDLSELRNAMARWDIHLACQASQRIRSATRAPPFFFNLRP